MADEVEWTGSSGSTYTFLVVPWPAPLDAGVLDGNYICARHTANGEWLPVYIGEGDLADPCAQTHPRFDQLLKWGVTHFHCHINDDASARRDEARDLLAAHPLAFGPAAYHEPVERNPVRMFAGARR